MFNKKFIILLIIIILMISCGKKPVEKSVSGDVGSVDEGVVRLGIIISDQKEKIAPFKLPMLDGKMVSLKDYRGKIIFLNFWATWCSPCIKEMPSMEELYKEMKGKDFEMLAISLDPQKEKVPPFVKALKLTFPILLDPKNVVSNENRIYNIPVTLILDKEGRLFGKVVGGREWGSPTSVSFFKKLSEINKVSSN